MVKLAVHRAQMLLVKWSRRGGWGGGAWHMPKNLGEVRLYSGSCNQLLVMWYQTAQEAKVTGGTPGQLSSEHSKFVEGGSLVVP